MSVARVNAHHREINALQLVPEPARHSPGLEADPFRRRRPFADHPGKCAGVGWCLALKQHLAVFIYYAYRGLFLRHIQSDILFHGCSPAGCFTEAELIGPRGR
jgi:hypothetical protein